MRRALLVAVPTVAFLACGGGGGSKTTGAAGMSGPHTGAAGTVGPATGAAGTSGPGTGVAGSTVSGGSVPLADLATETASKSCEFEVRCGFAADQASCVASTPSDTTQIAAYVNAGKVHYDGVAAATCLNAIAARSCNFSQSNNDIPSCSAAFTGTVAGGGPCSDSAVCVSQSCATGTCDPSVSCCAGTCRATGGGSSVPIGGDCSGPTATCAPQAYCDGFIQVCMARVAGGEPCTQIDACAAGFACVTGGQANGICGRLPAHGQPCSQFDGCDASTDFCDPTAMTCMTRLPAGSDCDPTADECVSYAFCDSATQKCVALSNAGEPCTDASSCFGSLECPNGVCALPQPRALCP
jgi:hypothetical protein